MLRRRTIARGQALCRATVAMCQGPGRSRQWLRCAKPNCGHSWRRFTNWNGRLGSARANHAQNRGRFIVRHRRLRSTRSALRRMRGRIRVHPGGSFRRTRSSSCQCHARRSSSVLCMDGRISPHDGSIGLRRSWFVRTKVCVGRNGRSLSARGVGIGEWAVWRRSYRARGHRIASGWGVAGRGF